MGFGELRCEIEERSRIPDAGSVDWTMVETIGAAAALQSRLCRASSPYTGEPLRFPWGCAEREIYVLFWAAIVGAGVPDGPNVRQSR